MRHAIFTQVTTYDADNNIIRDHIGTGGRRRVTRSKVELNVDANGLTSAKIVLDVSVTNGLCSITLEKPAEFDADVTDVVVKQPTTRKE